MRLPWSDPGPSAHGDKGSHPQQHHASTQLERGSASTVEHVMVEAEVRRLVQIHLAEGGCHGSPPSG